MNPMMPNSDIKIDTPCTYLIRVQGNVSTDWFEYFENISIVLCAPIDMLPISTIGIHGADQAALLGILNRLYSFRYPLLALECVGVEQSLHTLEP